MYHVGVTELRCEIGAVVSKAEFGKERTIIERRGKPAAAVVPIEDIELLERIEEQLVDEALVEEAGRRLAAKRPGIPLAEVKARLGL